MNTPYQKALIVIDIQNDYFPEGKMPLWNTEETLHNIESAIKKANHEKMQIVLIQHIATSDAPFFKEGSDGAKIHPRILQAAPNAKIIIKTFADSFEGTNLDAWLTQEKINELWVCGMMTQNCVTHTAISKKAENYKVSILSDCCTSVDEMIHNIALRGISTRVKLISLND